MPKTRHLRDLYKRFKDVTLDDGSGDPIVVRVQKLSPIEGEEARRIADAARARVLMIRTQPDDEAHLQIKDEVFSYPESSLSALLVADERARREPQVEAELAETDEWTKDNYLQGLRDAWIQDLGDRYAKDDQDPEAKKAWAELRRFAGLVDEETKERVADYVDEVDRMDLETLQSKVFDMFLTSRANLAWLTSYRKAEIYCGLKDPENPRERYFNSIAEVEELEIEVTARLIQSFRELTVDPAEGKDLPQTASSSSSSEQPEQAAEEEDSGQKDAAA